MYFFQDVYDVLPLAGTATTANQNPRIASVQRQAQLLDACSQENLQNEPVTDPEVPPIYNWLKNGISPTQGEIVLSSPAANFLWINREMLMIENWVIYKTEEEKKLASYPKFVKTKFCISATTYQCEAIKGQRGLKKSHKAVCPKLCPPWKSPAVVLEVLTPYLYRVQHGRQVSVVNLDKLRLRRDK
ncbi:hypothetical protein RRG08_057419 [Elysia crispata]|uniref:Uncharacterized protein n=1 Tax=Elysia crispata TaxID=231223 RepID=A0AAE1AKB1_9GAST|nr:hypothetical protein RRG08_057419 [Elysia crispata]